MKNDLCVHCDGRGFHWQKQYLMSHDQKETLADCYKQGPLCSFCNGTGKQRDNMTAIFAIVIVFFAVIAFVASPIIHWLTS